MTIHKDHPFPTDPDQARRLRGRLGGAVALVTTHDEGLTVSSVLVALGEPARVILLLDPDADLTHDLQEARRGVLQLLHWRHRPLAEAFAGQAPAPGGPFRLAEWEQTDSGRRLADAATWAEIEVEDVREVGWSLEVACRLVVVHMGEDAQPLEHRRGRYRDGGRQ